MSGANDGLTLEGLAQILRKHMDGTAAQFAEERAERQAQDAQWQAGLTAPRGEIGLVAALVRDLGQIVARHVDELDEHRRQIRQFYARMEQHDARMEQLTGRIEQLTARIEQHSARMVEHDARFEEMTREIRRILDALERRGGNGGGAREP